MAYKNLMPQLEEEIVVKKGKKAQTQQKVSGYGEKKQVYFAFIDVLGFKQTFDENRENPSSEFAEKYRDTFLYYGKLTDSALFSESHDQACAGQTSDSLFFYTDRLDFLVQFLKIYAHFSIDAMSRNVFFRGGIGKGSLFVNSTTQFYGDSVIKAYLLENSIARNPCIAIDAETYADVCLDPEGKSLVEALPKGRFCVKPFVYVSEKELLSLVRLDSSELHHIDKKTLKDVKSCIATGKKRFEFDDRNYQKYVYLEEKYEESKAQFQAI